MRNFHSKISLGNLALLSVSFLAMLYYTLGVVLVAEPGLTLYRDTESSFTVDRVWLNSPAAQAGVQVGDQIIAIDNQWVAHQVDWAWPNLVFQTHHQYTFQTSNGEVRKLFLTSLPLSWDVLQMRFAPHVVALPMWLVGALILLFATSHMPIARLAGNTFLGLGVGLSALSAALYRLPGGRIGSETLLPIVMAGLVELATLPHLQRPPKPTQRTLESLYLLAVILAVASAIEIFYISPWAAKPSWQGFQLLDALYIFAAICFLASLLIIWGRYLRTPRSPLKQALRALTLTSFLAIAPLVFGLLLPGSLFRIEVFGLLDFALPLLPLALLPLGYGYVIYRHQYIQLDRAFTHTLAAVVLGLGGVVLYGLFYIIARRLQLDLLADVACALLLLAGAVALLPPSRRAAQRVILGHSAAYHTPLARWHQRLAHTPELAELQAVVRELAHLLQVFQIALFLKDEKGGYLILEHQHVPALALPPNGPPEQLLTRSGVAHRPHAQQHPWLRRLAWAEVIIPLQVLETPVGVLALGPRVPDGPFDGVQVDFLRQVGEMLAVGAHIVQLFESCRALLRAQQLRHEAERAQLATDLHDLPLQTYSRIMAEITALLPQLPPVVARPLRQLLTKLQAVSQQLRAVCEDTRPTAVHGALGLALEDLAWKFGQRLGWWVYTHPQAGLIFGLPPEVETVFYYVALEALNNIEKHAQAKRVWVLLNRSARRLVLRIIDDGVGLPQLPLSAAQLMRGHHLGLVGMHERARQIGGELGFAPRPGGGTIVTLWVALAGEA